MNLLEPFLETVARRRGHTAIVDAGGRTISYGDLAARSARLAATWRRQGIGPGDRVLLAMPLGIDLYAGIAALWRLGATIVFPEPAMGLKGLRHAATVTRPKAYLSAGWFRLLRLVVPELRRLPLQLRIDPDGTGHDEIHDAASDHPALISFTSGSTGLPKGIVRSHGFLAAQNACVADLLAPTRDDETDLVAFPVFVIANLGLGVTSVLPNWKLTRHDRADPAAVARLIADADITRALIPPSICEVMTRGPEIAGLGAVFTGGGPVFPDLLERLSAKLPNADIVSVYGSTEAEPICHQRMSDTTAEDRRRMREGGGLLAGRPIPEIALAILDDEIVVTGDHVNKGYLDSADDASNKLRRDGAIWHRTGDAGAIDDKGRLWLLGRHGSRAGGLYPFTVEVAVQSWPGVRLAALVPGSDPPLLAIEGDGTHMEEWKRLAKGLGDLSVTHVASIPLDRRHRSKIDYAALARLTAKS